jgi:hypothetical protein
VECAGVSEIKEKGIRLCGRSYKGKKIHETVSWIFFIVSISGISGKKNRIFVIIYN